MSSVTLLKYNLYKKSTTSTTQLISVIIDYDNEYLTNYD